MHCIHRIQIHVSVDVIVFIADSRSCCTRISVCTCVEHAHAATGLRKQADSISARHRRSVVYAAHFISAVVIIIIIIVVVIIMRDLQSAVVL